MKNQSIQEEIDDEKNNQEGFVGDSE